MNALNVLKALRAVNASLHREGDGLILNSPRGAVSPKLAAEIRNNRTELLDLLKMVDASAGESASIDPLARPEDLPLGLTQQRFWYLASITPESAIYNLPTALRLSGELDIAALEKAINRIIARHEILRTRIVVHNYEPVQEIEPEINFRLEQVDLSTVDADAAMGELIRQIDIAGGKPIPMDQAPMLKAALYRLGPKDHVLFWNKHHVIWDAWSFDIFLKELQHIYGALEAGAEPVLAPLPLQYVDYALWHRQLVEGDKLAQHMEYWSTQLSGELPVLELTTDRPRPDMMSFEGGRAVLDIDSDIIARLTHIGREEGATLFMVLLAGFYAFLFRYTGQDDLIVGSPVQSRIYEGTDNIIGVFVNTLVLRTQLSPSLSFRELIGQVKALCISAYEHQDTPFEVLVEEFETERTLSRNPLYQVLFSYQDTTNREATLGTLDIEQLHIETYVAPTDLTIWLMETGEGLIGGIDYAAELFDHATVEKMIAHYTQLLAAGADNPLAAIGSLPMMSDSELAWLAQHATGPVLEIPQLSIDQLVEEKALHTPEAIAVKYGKSSLSYQQLVRKAELIAAQLRQKNIGENHLVGVCVKRNAGLLPILLGIFKSGAAYVPLDPEFPGNRLEHMISDASLSAIITDEKSHKSLPPMASVVRLLAEDLLAAKRLNGEDKSLVQLPTSRRAYVIYTSGSTGEPKGVEITHKAAVNLLLSMREQLSVQNSDQLLAITTLSFDISVLELFLPLLSGATVIVADQETTRNGVTLKQLIGDSEPTIIQATPATWRMLKDLDWEGSQSLTALCGGEEMPRDLGHWLCSVSKRVINVYGPTETTVWSSMYRVQGDELHIPIGIPIHNTRMYVLDEQLNPLPASVRGNLYIAGDGVAVGYRNLPELTAERFTTDSMLNDGSRMYCTGDQAKRRSDGLLEFYGRSDQQVKVRGFRVELGEIEAALLCLPEVREAAATTQQTETGEVRLLAYVVFFPDEELTITEFRKALRKTLPGYMIPSVYTELISMPKTPNGKVDRNSLSVSTQSAIGSGQAFRAAESDQEIIVADVWKELLHVDKISMKDNFFDLGGFSLLSMRCIAQIEELTGVRINPRELFFKTAGDLALLLQEQPKAERN